MTIFRWTIVLGGIFLGNIFPQIIFLGRIFLAPFISCDSLPRNIKYGNLLLPQTQIPKYSLLIFERFYENNWKKENERVFTDIKIFCSKWNISKMCNLRALSIRRRDFLFQVSAFTMLQDYLMLRHAMNIKFKDRFSLASNWRGKWKKIFNAAPVKFLM